MSETERERARQIACGILPIPYLHMPEFIEHAASVATAFAASETAALRARVAELERALHKWFEGHEDCTNELCVETKRLLAGKEQAR